MGLAFDLAIAPSFWTEPSSPPTFGRQRSLGTDAMLLYDPVGGNYLEKDITEIRRSSLFMISLRFHSKEKTPLNTLKRQERLGKRERISAVQAQPLRFP
jgi:hypothetical protein